MANYVNPMTAYQNIGVSPITQAQQAGNINTFGGNDILGDIGQDSPSMLIPGLQALSGAANAYTGYKMLGLGEDQFERSKQEYNRELANQGMAYNTQLEAGARGGMGDSGNYANDPQGFETALSAYVADRSVDTTAI